MNVIRTATGADDGTRTRNIDLGRVALYQLSYIRMWAEAPSKKDYSTSP